MAMSAAAAVIVIIVVLTAVLVAGCGETLRRRGAVRPRLADTYATPAALLAPYNLWCSERTAPGPDGGADVPFPSMETHFPDHRRLRDAWPAILAEADALRAAGHASGIAGDRFFTRIADGRWKKFYIKWYGDILPEARRLCPVTCSILDGLPGVHLAMFSFLEPGARIPPHTGPFKGCLRYHLGLRCPPAARITVDGRPYSWRAGEDVLFDDTYVHEVENPSDETRVVLFCDVERRLDTPRARAVNRWVCRRLGPFSNRANNRRETPQKS